MYKKESGVKVSDEENRVEGRPDDIGNMLGIDVEHMEVGAGVANGEVPVDGTVRDLWNSDSLGIGMSGG